MRSIRRRAAAALAGALVLPLLPTVAVAPVGHLVLAVSPAFRSVDLPVGARVRNSMRRVGAVEITTTAASVPALFRTPGVRGIWPDLAMHTTSDSYDAADGVLAPEAVGGAAGTSSAGRGVTVAVVDTGVADTTALKRSSGRLLRGPDFSGETSSARDGFGHGTFMANLVAGGAVDGAVIGVAPAAKVLDVKVAAADGSTSLSRVLRGLDWVAKNGAEQGVRIVSLSLAADRPTAGYGSDPLTDAADAVQAAGITVVVASGNDSSQVSDPGQDPQLMTIGAADTTGYSPRLAAFSGRGTVAGVVRPDLVAPGVRLLSMLPEGSMIAKSNPDARVRDLWRGSGTSQATAVAAGEVAVFLAGRTAVDPQDVRASFAAVATALRGDGDGAGFSTIPTRLVSSQYSSTTSGSTSGDTSPSPASTSWSSTSWSSTSWSSTSWSSTSWSSTSWSSTSWSSTGLT